MDPMDPLKIETGALPAPQDLQALVHGVEICRDIGNSETMRPFVKRAVMPGTLHGKALEDFVRNTASTVWRQSCTAKMRRDAMSVVDAQLRVDGIDGLRIADASIMPQVTTGNTMAPCVIIGERLGSLLTCCQVRGATRAMDWISKTRTATHGRRFYTSVQLNLSSLTRLRYQHSPT